MASVVEAVEPGPIVFRGIGEGPGSGLDAFFVVGGWPTLTAISDECIAYMRGHPRINYGDDRSVVFRAINGWARYRYVGHHQLELCRVYELEEHGE